MHRRPIIQFVSALCSAALFVAWAVAQAAGTQGTAKKAAAPQIATFKATTTIVLVNLTVRDSSGNLITNLKPSDVTVLEDGKKQHIESFDFQNVDAANTAASVANAAAASGAGSNGTIVAATVPKPTATPSAPSASSAATDQYANHRLIVMYFDLTTMQPEDVQNVMTQAETFVKNKMQPADLASIVTLGDNLTVNQDFTADRATLLRTLTELNPATGSGYSDGTTGSSDGTADDGSSFSADDTEINVVNADRSLESLESVCDMLAPVPEKKSMMYFSSGITRSGVDNELTLRSAVNSCVKANTAIYSVDALGLQALPPGGAANGGSVRGASAANGNAQMSALNSQFSQQDTISTLATDTGGKAFLDNNDFGAAYTQVQKDTSSYYLISYSSTNPAQDGKYRHIKILVDRPNAKISARPGYYAPRDINHLDYSDRQEQLQDELNADVTDNSLDLYMADGYLRLDANKYYVPVSLVIPGNEIPLHGIDPKATPEVDIAGEVIDETGAKLDHILQTVKLTPAVAGANGQLQNENLQYNSGFILAPGQSYQIRFAARENQTGQMGAFETILTIPDINTNETKYPHQLMISPVLVGSQLVATKPEDNDPLTASGDALVMSVNHVFSQNQHMYLYYEVYDPKVVGTTGDIHLLTNVAFFRGKAKAFESQMLTTEHVTDPKRGAAVVQIDMPLNNIKPGYYLVQIDAIDANAGRFAFPRVAVLVRPPAHAAAPAAVSSLVH